MFNYSHEDLYNPLITVLQSSGGSATNLEIEEGVANILSLSEEKMNDIYRGNITKFSFRLAIAKIYLKKFGLIDISNKGLLLLTKDGVNSIRVEEDEVNKVVKEKLIEEGLDDLILEEEIERQLSLTSNFEIKVLQWQENLLEIIKELSPSKFEKLCQRLLRELGFSNVEVTGKVGDGGIDGKGIFKLGGILSFNVAFQCKRYQGSVTSEEIRAFQGAIEGRADKGLFITTGRFTNDAKKEAKRDGSNQIDLIDGFELTEKLKENSIGVKVELVEKVEIIEEWFQNF